MEILIQKASNYTIFQKNNILEVAWEGSINLEQHQYIYHKLLTYSKANSINKWLLNQQKMMIHPKSCDWVANDFLLSNQDIINQGYCAIVIPDSFYVELSIRNILAKVYPHGNMRIFVFKTSKAALKWLNDQDNKKDSFDFSA